MNISFKKAVKRDAKLRMALCGPAGSGKTYTLLGIATELGGPIAYVDTEHGSASKYADLFQFDVIEPNQFDPRELIQTIKAAIEAGYRVICIDSLSHYWMGKGGELEMVDNAAKRTQSGNSFTAWKHVTPVHNELVDTIISASIHVLVSMRTKTEWVLEEDSRGKKVPRKIGLAPVMRDGIEFEFDVCGDLDQDNTLTVTKSRCPELSGKVINRPGKEVAQVLKAWLSGAPAEEPKPEPQPVTQPKPQAVQQPAPAALASAPSPAPKKNAFTEMLELFVAAKQQYGNDVYYRVLGNAGYEHANQIPNMETARKILSEIELNAKQTKMLKVSSDDFRFLKQKFAEIGASEEYERILVQHGGDPHKPQKPFLLMTPAVKAFQAAKEALVRLKSAPQPKTEPAGPFRATDDDLPPEMLADPAPIPADPVEVA